MHVKLHNITLQRFLSVENIENLNLKVFYLYLHNNGMR